jgi:hypothetical protein
MLQPVVRSRIWIGLSRGDGFIRGVSTMSGLGLRLIPKQADRESRQGDGKVIAVFHVPTCRLTIRVDLAKSQVPHFFREPGAGASR